MQCTAVRCAVQAISEAIGQLPVHVYSRAADGSKERAPEHPAYRLIHDAANDWTSASDFREQLQRDALLHGNGVAFINRVGGKPVELLRLDPSSISIDQDTATGEPIYSQNTGKSRQRFARQDIFHLKAPGFDGVKGVAPIYQAREAIGLALILERHGASFFGAGGKPDGLLTTDSKLGADAAARMGVAWKATFGGGRSGGTPVLEEGLKYQPVTFNSTDSQYLENRIFQIQEIARAFRVPPIFLMELGRSTWGNGETMGRQFVDYCLRPWALRWESEIRLKLIHGTDHESHFAEFLFDDFLKADAVARMDAYSRAISARILNPNEVRSMENRAPYKGGDAFANPNTSSAATSSLTQEKPQ